MGRPRCIRRKSKTTSPPRVGLGVAIGIGARLGIGLGPGRVLMLHCTYYYLVLSLGNCTTPLKTERVYVDHVLRW